MFDQRGSIFDKLRLRGLLWSGFRLNFGRDADGQKTNQPLVGHQMAFLTIVGFWVFHAVIVSLRSAVMDFPSQDELALRRIMVTVVGIALTWLLYLVLRMFDRQPLGVRVATAFLRCHPMRNLDRLCELLFLQSL